MENKTYYTLGLMSGSSLDGLDIAYCAIEWSKKSGVSSWKLLQAETLPFSEKWQNRLKNLPQQDALTFAKTHTYFGHYLAELVNNFCKKHQISHIDCIASHGHTIFHNPDQRLSIQIGDGAALAALTGFTAITNFRSSDIALNGEGAPLAPMVDQYLFEGYDYYLNIGGIANISAKVAAGKWIGFDICPANQILNHLSGKLGHEYDDKGTIAGNAEVNAALLHQVAQNDFYPQPYPKSLGNEWIRKNILPQYLFADDSWENKLATATEHIAIELLEAILMIRKREKITSPNQKMLITGGGAFNDYLIECIQEYLQKEEGLIIDIHLPSKEIIQFKEAILMALLGVLRLEKVPNAQAATTGADRNTINGAIYHP